MKKKILFIVMAIMVIFMANALVRSQAPTRLFDVRAGNGIVDNGTAQPVADYIVYKDAASLQKIADAFASAYGYTAVDNPAFNPALPENAVTNPKTIAPTNPQKRIFFRQKLTAYIKDVYKAQQAQSAATTASASAAATADAILPPQ